MAHTNQDRWATLVDAKLRNTLVTRDNLVFNSRYEGNPKAGKVKIPVRDTEVEVKTYDKADGRHAPPRPADETGGACLAQPSKFPSGRRPAPEIWATARGSRLPVTRALQRRKQHLRFRNFQPCQAPEMRQNASPA